MIIGQHQKNIRYVDCFSGPWQEGSNDLQDTSIGIALKIIEKCQNGLKANGKNVSFHALFIEKNNKSFKKLQNYLADVSLQNISTKALSGDFFELREQILSWCGGDDFTFFFIDPKGWKNVVEIPTLTPLLHRPNSEFLINFMYDFVLRSHSQDCFQEDMLSIFGEIPNTEAMTPEEKEAHLVNLYKKRLKQIFPSWGGRPRAVSVPVLKPTIDRTLYHLVYLTRHQKGICVFMEASERLDFVQRRTRAEAKQRNRETRSHQLELFSAADGVRLDKHVDLAEVKSYWLTKLKTTPGHFGNEELADMLEETGWFESDFQISFGDLEKEGKVENLDKTGKRRSKFVHFEKNERLVKVKS